MKITLSITKGDKDNTYRAKFTSGSWQGSEKPDNNATAEEIGKLLAELIEKADEAGQIGRK